MPSVFLLIIYWVRACVYYKVLYQKAFDNTEYKCAFRNWPVDSAWAQNESDDFTYTCTFFPEKSLVLEDESSLQISVFSKAGKTLVGRSLPSETGGRV